jgi:prepilin-type processing-associated H-X9-DG protein
MVELIVVLGIIGLLLSMLLPTIRRAQQQARAIQCASQLRQLGQALRIYANYNHDWLPRFDYWHTYPDGGSAVDGKGLAWTELLMPYYVAPNSSVYNCPVFPEGYPCNYFIEARWPRMNDRFSMQFSDIRMSGRFVLSGDCTHPFFYAAPFGIRGPEFLAGWDCDKDDAVVECLLFRNQPGGLNMHPGGNNVLFDDGHVARFDRFDRSAMTYDPQQMLAWDEVPRDPKLGPIPPPPP